MFVWKILTWNCEKIELSLPEMMSAVMTLLFCKKWFHSNNPSSEIDNCHISTKRQILYLSNILGIGYGKVEIIGIFQNRMQFIKLYCATSFNCETGGHNLQSCFVSHGEFIISIVFDKKNQKWKFLLVTFENWKWWWWWLSLSKMAMLSIH